MSRNNLIGLLLGALIIIGTWYYLRQKDNPGNLEDASKQVVGGDKDDHSCIGSAGYSWSALKGECIRLFEAGIPMTPKDDTLDQTQAAYVVFKSPTEYQIGELYLPGREMIALTFSEGKWSDKDNTYRVFKNGNNLMLLDSGSRLLYATDN